MNDKKDKHVRIALAVLPEQRHFTSANNLAATLELAEKAGKAKCDLIAFEENGIHLFVPPDEKFPSIPGPQTDAIAKIAKKHSMYIAAGMTGTVDGVRRKLVVLFDRNGEISEIYAKQQLTDGEKKSGAVEGDVCRPIDTDFGRIAFLICYDTQFPALSQMLGAQRTDLIVCPHVGGAGGNGGKLLGGAFASQNHCWLAWVGRYVTSMINPFGNEIAKLKIGDNLLITDIELNPRRIIPSTIAPIVDRKEQQFTQLRPDYYNCPFPAIIAEFPEYPTYCWNQLPLGRKSFEIVLRNRTELSKKGSIDIAFPLKCVYNSNTQQPFYIDHEIDADWLTTPKTIEFELSPNGSQKIEFNCDIPLDAKGVFLAKISGTSKDGDCVVAQRQFSNLPTVPELSVPKLTNVEDVRQHGATIPLEKDFFGSNSRSHNDVKIGFTDKNLLIYAKMEYLETLDDASASIPDALMVVVTPVNPEESLFWFQIPHNGIVKYQRREYGYMVKESALQWNVERDYSEKFWEALISIPFKELGEIPAAGDKWRFNLERRAQISAKYEETRITHVVQTPSMTKEKCAIAAEWACWSPHYARIDNADRLGIIHFPTT